MTTAATGATGDAANEVRGHLLDLLVEVSEGKYTRDEIDPSANFLDYGYVDSLSGVAFLARIEEHYGVKVDDLEFVERLNTLDALTGHLLEQRQ